MDDELLHIRVSKKLKEQMQILIDEGYFNNYTEIAREGLRNTVIKFKDEIKEAKSANIPGTKKKQEKQHER